MADQDVTRKILYKIDNDPTISQKRLAEEIGISVGMINWHVKRCVSKGLIKLQQAPVRRYLYYLTPEGFVEKAQLTASYLQTGFDIFRIGRKQYDELFQKCTKNGWSRIALFGDTELTELALFVATRFSDIEIIGVVDKETLRSDRRGVKITTSAHQLNNLCVGGRVEVLIACHYMSSIDEFMNRNLLLEELNLDQSHFLIPEFLK